MSSSIIKKASGILKMPGKPIPMPPTMAIDAFRHMQDAVNDYKKTVEIERTKREAISSWKDVELEKIKHQKETLELYLKESFKERAVIISGLFEALDKGIESNNIDIISQSMSGIVNIARESPLAQATEAIEKLRDPTVKSLDW